MKTLILYLLFLCLISSQQIKANPTFKEIAGFLNIDSWESQLSDKSKSHLIELFQIKDGKVIKKAFLKREIRFHKNSNRTFKILIGPLNDKLKFMIYSGSTSNSLITKQEKNIEPTKTLYSTMLPVKIQAGDYVLYGAKLDVNIREAYINNVKLYSSGILLRLTENIPMKKENKIE